MSRFVIQDHYFSKAKSEGYVARSVYKLIEPQKKYKILKQGQTVLDLGAAPGSFLQYAAQTIGKNGLAVGIDLTPINLPLKNVFTIEKDIFTIDDDFFPKIFSEKEILFAGFDVVLSDMAPKTCGIKHVDQIRSFNLSEKALDIAKKFLKPGGHVFIKIFESGDVKILEDDIKKNFNKLHKVRPKGVRKTSSELYLLGYDKR